MCLFFTHIPFMVNRTLSTISTERLQQLPLFAITNRTDCKFYLWRLHLAWPSHPGHSTILLRSKSVSGRCTKLHTVVTSNNRDHLTRSLYYCLFVPHIREYRCYSSCTSRSWWTANSTQRQPRGCCNTLGLVHCLCHMT